MEGMTWITNHPKSYKAMVPRRLGVEYFDGEPKSTDDHSTESIKEMGIVGVYVKITTKEYYSGKYLLGNPNNINQLKK